MPSVPDSPVSSSLLTVSASAHRPRPSPPPTASYIAKPDLTSPHSRDQPRNSSSSPSSPALVLRATAHAGCSAPDDIVAPPPPSPCQAIQIERGRAGLHREAATQGWLFFIVTRDCMPAAAASAPALVLPATTHAVSILTCVRAASDDPCGWELQPLVGSLFLSAITIWVFRISSVILPHKQLLLQWLKGVSCIFVIPDYYAKIKYSSYA
jgi:hypothetical protein